ncbi:leucyl/phenylalanyl-tRNA--protein transferase [Sphingomonas flavalba]|uniref:leucyl/phenylalanyl-tRNA--protein transferase n=1 Tax=Sphingomonas flavalba TaxID=2559804 RepID=UPI0039E0F505
MPAIDPSLLLRAYAMGVFPMADARDVDDVYWVEPRMRGVLPLDGFHLSRSLAKTIRSDRFTVTADRAFPDVIAACAEMTEDRPGTWINARIEQACIALHAAGHAHSIECWRDDTLVGGLYGISLGRAFFGESMFSRARDASKVAIAHLVARLRVGGYTLLDCQFITDHLASLGAVEIPRDAYVAGLADALGVGVAAGAGKGAGDGVASGEGVGFGVLDTLFAPPADPADGTVVPGPIAGCVIVQLLGQTS